MSEINLTKLNVKCRDNKTKPNLVQKNISIQRQDDLISEKPFFDMNKIDWNFTNSKTYLTHKIHPYPARFIPQIASSLIKNLSKKNDIVLDPFCGSGTTILESFMNNRDSIGSDLNPLSILISKMKTTSISPIKFSRALQRFDDFEIKITKKMINEEISILPKRKITSLLSNQNIKHILLIKNFINCQNDSKISNLCRLTLSSTLWYMFNSKKSVNILEVFKKKIAFIHEEILNMNYSIDNRPSVTLFNKDINELYLKKGSVDLVITSPPYVNALDYHRTHMYNMHFLEYNFKDLRKHEIGSHSKFVHNRFRLLSEYLGDMLKFLFKMNHALDKNRYCAVILGTSTIEFEKIEPYKLFEKYANVGGFVHKKTFFRNIDPTTKYTNSKIGNINDEQIVILQKDSNCAYSLKNIHDSVTSYMFDFLDHVKKNPGSSINNKIPTKKRLKDNQSRILDAIEQIKNDI